MTDYSVIGLGKLGASMTAAIARQGHRVVGMDVDEAKVEAVREGRAPVYETDLDETIGTHADRIQTTTDAREAVAASDVTFVVVPTPSDERGAFSLEYLRGACRSVGEALADEDDYHLVVITSTVLPGSTRHGLLPVLEEASGKACGEAFGLCYSPEFIALGSVIRDFLHPDFTLVGEFDRRSGDLLERCYEEILAERAPCKRMALENAELAKIALNTYVTTKISFANMLAEFCERLPGGDVDAVTDALGEDGRIGHACLTGALGYGGPCFPRDNQALGFIADELGVDVPLARATDQVNRSLPRQIHDRIAPRLEAGETVGVLGLAYKPGSHVVEESQGLELANEFARGGHRVVAYDPLARETAREVLEGSVELADSARVCLEEASTVLVVNPDDEFRALAAEDFRRGPAPKRVVDFWRVLGDRLDGVEGVEYLPFGRQEEAGDVEDLLRRLWARASPPSAAGAGR